MTKQFKADLMLILVTLFWGVSYLFMDLCLRYMEPFGLNAFRFSLAFLVAFIVAFPKLKSVNRETLKYSAILGFILMIVYFGATFGVQYTSLSNAGFLCALAVVITPIFGFFFKGQKAEKKLILVVILCLAGIGLLTLNEKLQPAVGDLLCILCAVAYAVDLLVTESAVQKESVNPFQLGVYQLGFTGIFNLILALVLEDNTLPKDVEFWFPALFLAIFCTGVAFIVQVMAQQYTSAAHVGVIFTLEPVFAGFVAYFFAGEILTSRGYLGAILLIIGLFIMEIDWKILLKKKEENVTGYIQNLETSTTSLEEENSEEIVK